jgi:hypothetical protein
VRIVYAQELGRFGIAPEFAVDGDDVEDFFVGAAVHGHAQSDGHCRSEVCTSSLAKEIIDTRDFPYI